MRGQSEPGLHHLQQVYCCIRNQDATVLLLIPDQVIIFSMAGIKSISQKQFSLDPFSKVAFEEEDIKNMNYIFLLLGRDDHL